MRILLLGKNGQVGGELQRLLAPLGEIVALDHDCAPGLCGDFARPENLAATVRALRPDAIIKAAAHTAADKVESDPDIVRLFNVTTTALKLQNALLFSRMPLRQLFTAVQYFRNRNTKAETSADANVQAGHQSN